MARDPRVVSIDGATYHLASLPPRRALKLLVRVLRATGPGLAAVIAGATSGKKLLEMDMEVVGDMARTIFAMLTPEEHDAIMAELLSNVRVVESGKLVDVMGVFDMHFQGRLPAALKLEWEALAENYRDFGDALAVAAPAAGAPGSPSKG